MPVGFPKPSENHRPDGRPPGVACARLSETARSDAIEAIKLVHAGWNDDVLAVGAGRDRIGDGVRNLQPPGDLERDRIDLAIDAAVAAEGDAAVDHARRGVDPRTAIDALDEPHLGEIDDVQMTVAGAAEDP